ncbi:hypothetical protein BJY01DRAFT_257165 [Aspergillus pseudoustus]|uniref:DUF4238 domain-containing protein n=1 Tax=Aspergillus pseudoustus TaxID=1810923 RepID=A0ABR4JMD6_9EURO
MPKEQKHHFIPRFILRKFAPADQPPASPAARSKQRPRGRDFLVNKVDLKTSILTQRPVSTEFALVDMYRDPGFDENPYHLEEKLSQLEGKASEIISKAAETFARTPVLELDRPEVDTLRKFLFLMKYRNGGMFERYNHDDAQAYDSDDRPRMLRYMAAKGFTKPRDVWFDNLRHMLDLKMDAQKTWRQTLRKQIYPDDAMMFELHLLHSYMAFCQPANVNEEFLLTENAFGIFEGPSTVNHDIFTGKKEAAAYMEYHNFAPMSPRLIIILRSLILPIPGDKGNHAELRRSFAAAMKSVHLHPDKAGSVLEDLPIRPCKTAYKSENVDSTASFSVDDRFIFLCFKLSSVHISIINNLFIEEAYQTSSIVYHSATALRAAIEKYFTDDTPGLKHVIDNTGFADIINIPEDKRLVYLRTLEKILCDLGASTTCKFKSFGLRDARFRIHMALNVGHLVGEQILSTQHPPKSLPREYTLLKPKSTLEEFWYDLDQGSRLVMLKTKLDGALNRSGSSDGEKATVRFQIHEFLMAFPVERLWFYFKILRNLKHCDKDDIWTRMPALELAGPEDWLLEVIADLPPKMRETSGRKMYMVMMTL